MDNWTKEVLNEIKQDIKEIRKSQAQTEKDLFTHIKRTDIAEENIKLLREEFKPVKSHVTRVNGIIWFISFVGTVGGVAKLFGLI